MRENVHIRPTGEIELGAYGKKLEAGFGKARPTFPSEHRVKNVLQSMQIGDIVGGVSELPFREFRRTPIGTLLFLGKVRAKKFPHNILQAMLVRVGANEL